MFISNNNWRFTGVGIFLSVLFLFLGCNPQSQGFVLPEGDIEQGRSSFVKLDCNQCHFVADIERKGEIDDPNVKLGGLVANIDSHGELVTSIINPSHRIARRYLKEADGKKGESKMKSYNDVMTVQELVDIVTFLQSEYEIPPSPPRYY